MSLERDPILAALMRIEAKQDELLTNQQRMDEEIQQIRDDCRRNSLISGGGGGIVAAGIELIRMKLGIY